MKQALGLLEVQGLSTAVVSSGYHGKGSKRPAS